MITKRYFIGEGPEALDLIQEAMDGIRAARKKQKTLEEKWDCFQLYMSPWGNKFIGIITKGPVDRSYLKKGELFHEDGESYWAYSPKRSTKLGKAMLEDFEQEGLVFQASKHIVNKLGVDREVYGLLEKYQRMGFAHSVAGFHDGKIMLKVPTLSDDDPSKGREEDFPEMPSWVREVRRSEFISLQEDADER